MKKLTFKLVALLIIFVPLFVLTAKAQKMSADEIILKHLDSIGTKEKRAEIKNRVIFFDVEFKAKSNVANAVGKAVILSEGEKSLWGMNLNSNDYPQDRFGFDGKEVKAGFIRPGVRSILGGFILSYSELLKGDLLGGTLSSWTLLNTDSKNYKVSYEGTKKIDGKEAYILSYSPKGGSDLETRMFFDSKTYRHIRTEYSRIIAARQGASIDSSAGQSSNYYKLSEDFSNFQTVNGLTIPNKYVLHYSSSVNSPTATAQNGTRELDWVFNVTNVNLNGELPADSFDINGK